jgi:hypothetical protein
MATLQSRRRWQGRRGGFSGKFLRRRAARGPAIDSERATAAVPVLMPLGRFPLKGFVTRRVAGSLAGPNRDMVAAPSGFWGLGDVSLLNAFWS